MNQSNLEKLSTYLLRMEENKMKNDEIEAFAVSALKGVNLVTKARTRYSFDTATSSGGTIQLMFHARTIVGNHKTITLTLRTFEHSINTVKTLMAYEGDFEKVYERRKLCFK
jgi:ABC-type microcin C transport system duplicated ATPase subunit YejF